jgi:hypothetical protein
MYVIQGKRGRKNLAKFWLCNIYGVFSFDYVEASNRGGVLEISSISKYACCSMLNTYIRHKETVTVLGPY